MLKPQKIWGIAAGCLLAWSQQGTAADVQLDRSVDSVFAARETSWLQLADATAEAGVRPNIQQVSCFGADEELGDPWTAVSLLGDDPCINFGGWMSMGYHNRKDGTFSNYPHHAQLQQGWMFVEKATDGSEGWDFGGRLDFMYGTDANNTQAFGNDLGVFDYSDTFSHGDLPATASYGWAIPQLYAEAAYQDWKFKAGHYFTMHGYEVVPATGNFFYSHAFTMNYSEAFTHTGVHSTYTGIENVELYMGYALGWDTGFDQFDGGSIFHGGFKITPVEDIAFTYVTSVGNLGWVGKGYAHSIVVDFTLTDKLHYITASDWITTDDSEVIGKDYDTIGWNNYLIYWATDRLGFGGRAEWWKAQGVSYYETTVGVNIKPIPNFVLRPELRYQWSPSAEGVPANNQIGIPSLGDAIFGVDGILTF